MNGSKNITWQKSILMGALFVLLSGCSVMLSAQDSLSYRIPKEKPAYAWDTAKTVGILPFDVMDTLTPDTTAELARVKVDSAAIRRAIRRNRIPEPERAAILSAILPGLGQAYVGKYWKIPMIYGVGYGLFYFYNYFNDYYYYYKDAYATASAAGDDTKALQNNRDYAVQMRNYFMIGIGAVYLLNIIDSMTDAYFRQYDISPDLSLKISPKIIIPNLPVNNPQGFSYGISLSFGLK